MQYTAVVKNLIAYKPNRSCMVMRTGMWSNQNYNEVRKYVDDAKLTLVTDAITEHESKAVSDPSTWNIDKEASFFSMCSNETVNGIEFRFETFPFHLIPKDCPIVVDMSSNIGTTLIPWDKLGMVYAGT
jgi:phosphoserine aminotransferase